MLDKWELGEPLSWKLAIPSLDTIMAASTGNPEEDHNLAAAVYEALEPSILWKHLYKGVESEMKEGNTKVGTREDDADFQALATGTMAAGNCDTAR